MIVGMPATAPKFAFVARTCRYGHGPLDLVDGWFSLGGARVAAGLAGLATQPVDMFGVDPSRLFALRVWRCPACGYVELIDEDL